MDSHRNIVIGACFILKKYKEIKDKRKRVRRWYARPLNDQKLLQCYYKTYFEKMKSMDMEQFFLHTRMSRELYSMLLTLIETAITKPKQRIHADERLSITLLFLAHGASMQTIAWTYKIGKSTVRLIILETCDAIWSALSILYLSEPSQSQYSDIAADFNTMWNFPNCVGAIDGKHIAIKCPKHSGTTYFNYKKFFSIVLMGTCDARYTFTAVSVGSYGSESDGGILRASAFGQALLDGKLPLPPNAVLPKSQECLPHVFVADAAFPLNMRIMRPFAPSRNGERMNEEKNNFNYRLSRARRVIENSFGILVARWRVLRTTMEFMPENAEKIVLACVSLHNFIMLHDMASYCPATYVDHSTSEEATIPGQWRTELEGLGGQLRSVVPTHARRSGQRAFELRDKFAHYFNNEGSVSFQPSKL